MAENTVSVMRDAEESRGGVGGTSRAAWSLRSGPENLVLCCEKAMSVLVMCERAETGGSYWGVPGWLAGEADREDKVLGCQWIGTTGKENSSGASSVACPILVHQAEFQNTN